MDMNRFSSHPNHENRPLYEGPPPQGLSEARWAGNFLDCLVTDPPHRMPRRRRFCNKPPGALRKRVSDHFSRT